MKTYLWTPTELQALPDGEALFLGPFAADTHASFTAQANDSGVPNPKLIVTVAPKAGTVNMVAVLPLNNPADAKAVSFEASDTCYPITANEWAQFQAEEAGHCRLPIQVWVVDGSKYTAPI
jgi:hypothetical protein